MQKKALLLMNMGGATTKSELEMFLKNMFRDPNILTIPIQPIRKLIAQLIVSKRLDTSWANYERIGGSPLPHITDELIEKLTEKVGNEYRIFPVMCYTKPGNTETLEILQKEGITEAILFPLYPHYSTTTAKSSVESFLAKAGNILESIRIIEPFYRNNSYNEILTNIISETLENQDPREYELVFSAHGLPEKIVKKGDPYRSQIEEHVAIITKNLEAKNIHFSGIHLAYQSRIGPMKWIGPSLDATLSVLTGKKVIVLPLSFTIDNSETKHELDIEYREVATGHGILNYRVCSCPNSREDFQNFLESFLK